MVTSVLPMLVKPLLSSLVTEVAQEEAVTVAEQQVEEEEGRSAGLRRAGGLPRLDVSHVCKPTSLPCYYLHTKDFEGLAFLPG